MNFQTNKMVFKTGDTVTVFNFNPLKGNYFIEGEAKIIKPVTGLDRFLVEFPDGDRVERFIDCDGQANPEEYLKQLNAARG